jgi:hypothetical protein
LNRKDRDRRTSLLALSRESEDKTTSRRESLQRFPLQNQCNHPAITMARILFFLALVIAAASAFVHPASHAGE